MKSIFHVLVINTLFKANDNNTLVYLTTFYLYILYDLLMLMCLLFTDN